MKTVLFFKKIGYNILSFKKQQYIKVYKGVIMEKYSATIWNYGWLPLQRNYTGITFCSLPLFTRLPLVNGRGTSDRN
jgi:hypothetical protein